MHVSINQSEADNIPPTNQNAERFLPTQYFHPTQSRKLENPTRHNLHHFGEMNHLFHNRLDWPHFHQRNSTYAHPTNTQPTRLITPDSASSVSSFETQDESSERPSVIVKRDK